MIFAIISGVGVSLVGLFQGSDENVANGLIAFHQFGAQGVIVAGNIMAILVGAASARIGPGRGRSIASIPLGIIGLVSFAVFMTDVFSGWAWNIGMFERGAIYPIMVAHVLLGTGLLSAHRTAKAVEKGIATQDGPMELTTILPGAVVGPILTGDNVGTATIIQRMLQGRMRGAPKIGLEVADIAKALKAGLGERAAQASARELPNALVRFADLFNPELRSLTVSLGRRNRRTTRKAQRVLGWAPRPAEQTAVECAGSLISHGVV